MDKFSFLSLAKNALSGHKNWQQHWRSPSLKSRYDVVIVGGGGHGLATAYYLAKKHGITNVAILEKGWIGGGNTGRNTQAIRSNYFYREATEFFDHSLKLYEGLSHELNYNIMLSKKGVLTLAHSEHELEGIQRWATAIQINGVDSEFMTPQQIKEFAPIIDISKNARFPIAGGFIQRRGGIARHDAVGWAYARAADALGIDIIQSCAVTGLDIKDGKIQGVKTSQGDVLCDRVGLAVAGHTSVLAEMAGFQVPITSMALQAMVTEPMKPFLDAMMVSPIVHAYMHQSDRGELVFGGAADMANSYGQRGNIPVVEENVRAMIELFPCVSRLKLMRQWAGIVDVTPDTMPIIGKTPVKGLYINGGWGTGGFKGIPAGGDTFAHTIAKDNPHPLVEGLSMERFRSSELVNEAASSGVAH